MDAVLEQLVLDRLGASELSEEAQDLVLAACDGAAGLELALGGEAAERASAAGQLELGARDLGVHLASIAVQGFRGVGATVRLELGPGPGLTIVAGRNGSGKSSFAEALELLMTGANSRWTDRTKVWTEGWQNLHHDSETVLAAELHVEGEAGLTRLRRSWPAGSALTPGECEARGGDGEPTTLDALGWRQAVSRYRPFLSFNELGQMFDRLSTMYDALAAILGLEDVENLAACLRDARLARDRAAREARDGAKALRSELEGVQDPRAGAVLSALSARPIDLDAIELTLDGVGEQPGGDLDVLRSITSFTPPTVVDLDERTAALDAASAELAAIGGTDAGRAHSVARLLRAALEHHEQHGSRDCLVCGTAAALGGDWEQQTTLEILRLDQQAKAVEQALAARREAARRVVELLPPRPPAMFAAARDLDLDPGPLELAWERWAEDRDQLEDPSSLARLRETVGRLGEAAGRLRLAAAAELDRREDVWRPVARSVAAWLPGARAAADAELARAALKLAEAWVKQTAADLQAARLAPIADAAKLNWELLRQESNVSLEGFHLRKSGNTRAAEVDVRVDGSDASAFGVMSQGELHALAVSVFLPRASLPESPFRFVVIDDPVQSMDPAKVDGLARALAGAATERQVIVFTHDERLPEAARRLGLDATVLEVTRRPQSVVEIRTALDPIERHLDDARALVRSDDVPAEVVAGVVPGFCRGAIEAACTLVIRRRRLGGGASHVETERELDRATTLHTLLSLVLFDAPDRGGDVLSSVNNRFGRPAGDAVRAANRGVHETLGADLRDLVRDTGVLARKLAEMS